MGTKRHQFQQSKVALFSAWGTGVAISAITQAAPAVVTAAAHGLATGDVVKIANVLGAVEANGDWIVTMLTADTFSLFGSDGTGWGAWISGGLAQKATFGNWCEVTNFQRQGGSKPETDVSSLCSTAQEIELGLPSYGSATLATNWAPDTTMQSAVDAAYDSGAIFPLQYQPKGAKTQTSLLGFIQQTSESAQQGGVWVGSVNYRITGRPMRVALATAL